MPDPSVIRYILRMEGEWQCNVCGQYVRDPVSLGARHEDDAGIPVCADCLRAALAAVEVPQ